MKKLTSSLVCIFFAISLFSAGFAYAADTNDPVSEYTVVTQEVIADEQTEQFMIWGTLAEAQAYYGTNWTYGCEGLNMAAGYYLCFYIKADGTRFYFGCYSL